MREIIIKADDGLNLSATIFEAKNSKALVQIIHGSQEHRKRYYGFAEFLCSNGFTVIVSDNRGHGESVNAEYPLGYMDGYDRIINDQMCITKHLKALGKNKKVYLIGHSLGSIFARCYLQQHDNEISKLVLIGTPPYISGANFGIFLSKLIMIFSGKYGYNKLLGKLGNGADGDDWLSVSQSNIMRFRNDSLCGIPYQNNAKMTIFQADSNLIKYKKYRCQNSNLKILNLSGELDPVTGGENGVASSLRALRKIGYRNIINKTYENMKHEVLNEENNYIVYNDVIDFLNT